MLCFRWRHMRSEEYTGCQNRVISLQFRFKNIFQKKLLSFSVFFDSLVYILWMIKGTVSSVLSD